MRSKEIEDYKKKLKLTREQREVIVGLLLGDAHLETQNGGRTYRLKIEQSEFHQSYVTHLYGLFSGWVRTPPKAKKKIRNGRESQNFWFQTLSHGAFRYYAKQFYSPREKQIPNLIGKLLTPRTLAYWYMDDGSIKSKQSKGVLFNTQGFQKREVARLCNILNKKFDLICTERKQKDGYQIYVSGKSLSKFKKLVGPYIIPEMNYKIPK